MSKGMKCIPTLFKTQNYIKSLNIESIYVY